MALRWSSFVRRGLIKPSCWVHVACVALLLFAQHVALAHAAWHQAAPFAVGDAQDHHESFHAGVCDLDGVMAQVLGGAGPVACHPAVAKVTAQPSFGCNALRAASESPAQRSRGPPVLR